MRLPMLCAAVAALFVAPAARAAVFECLIQPNQVVEIRSPAEGLISKVHVQRGDLVKTGQTLVKTIIESEYLNGEVIRLDGAIRMQPK